MSVAAKIIDLMMALKREDVEALPPVGRRQLADLCRWVGGMTEPKIETPKTGVLSDLQSGAPRHE